MSTPAKLRRSTIGFLRGLATKLHIAGADSLSKEELVVAILAAHPSGSGTEEERDTAPRPGSGPPAAPLAAAGASSTPPPTAARRSDRQKPLPAYQRTPSAAAPASPPTAREEALPLPMPGQAPDPARLQEFANLVKKETHAPQPPAEKAADLSCLDGVITTCGVLEIFPEGFGLLRSPQGQYLSGPDDTYVPQSLIRQWGLKVGDTVEGKVRLPREGDKYYALTDVEKVNGLSPGLAKKRVPFHHLTPVFPHEPFKLVAPGQKDRFATRIIELFAPIGKGQRSLIVAQPKTGKTYLLKDIAKGIAYNHPEVHLIALLIDERPEEVTDFRRVVNAEVFYSTFDKRAENHVRLANMVLERARSLVESGYDVVIMLDSITRLARAFNTVTPSSGRVLSGGVDANALHRPKQFFGAARNIEGGGSLTIIASALVGTNSAMDEVIFQEFKGTGNSEVWLESSLSSKGLFPAISIVASSTREAGLLQSKETLYRVNNLRQVLSELNPREAIESVIKNMRNTKDNEELLAAIPLPAHIQDSGTGLSGPEPTFSRNKRTSKNPYGG